MSVESSTELSGNRKSVRYFDCHKLFIYIILLGLTNISAVKVLGHYICDAVISIRKYCSFGFIATFDFKLNIFPSQNMSAM